MSREFTDAVAISQKTELALIQELYSFSITHLILMISAAAAFVFAFWPIVPKAHLLLWCGAFTLALGYRYALQRRFQRDSPVGWDLIPWRRRFVVWAAVSGLLWGLTGTVFFPVDSLANLFLLALFIGGVAVSAVLILSHVIHCSILSVCAILLPFAFRLLYQGGRIELTLGAFIILGGGMLVVASKQLNRIMSESYELRFKKDELFESLKREKNRVEELNTLIEAEALERKMIAERLGRSERRYRGVINSQSDLVCRITDEFRLSFVNEAYCRCFCRTRDDLLGISITEALVDDDRDLFAGALESLSPTEPTQAFEVRLHTPGGELLWVQWVALAEFDKREYVVEYQLVGRDITDRKRMESQLKASLKEKEILLKEIHHRVKNNLNVIISLLHLQQRRVADKEVFESLKETEFRVRCIGVIHEKLYGSANLADLNINEFLSTLTDHLTQMYETVGTQIRITKDFESIVFPLDSVLPLGFITSELLSNSLKHAFPNNSNGEIHLSLRSIGDGKYEFMLKDTGVGFGNDVDLDNLKSLGLDLVRSFTKQLDGDLYIKANEGTTARIVFAA